MRVTWRARTFDARTRDQLAELDRLVGPDISIRPTQGSYSDAVGASAGTHSGGGAGDLSARGHSAADRATVVRCGRRVGLAIYYRPARAGVWPEHYHFISPGCPDLAPAAARQVEEFFAGGDGLVGNAPDPHRGVLFLRWEEYSRLGQYKLRLGSRGDGVVGLQKLLGVSPVRNKAFGPKTYLAVKRYQKAHGLVVDGVVGPQTWKPILAALKEPVRG